MVAGVVFEAARVSKLIYIALYTGKHIPCLPIVFALEGTLIPTWQQGA